MPRLTGRNVMAAVVVLLLGVALAGSATRQPDLDRARANFERHNYKAALDIVERYLESDPEGENALTAALLRSRCRINLGQWEDGVTELQALLDENPELAGRVDLHEALARVGLRQHRFKHLAIIHFEIVKDLHLKAGDRQAAATALLNQANAYAGFDQWQDLPGFDGVKPKNWQDSRRLQQRLASEALDQAITLAGETDLAAEATFRKGQLYLRFRRGDSQEAATALEIFGRLVATWPKAPRAPEALFQMGQILEGSKQDFVAAVDHYRSLLIDYEQSPWSARGAQRMQRILATVVELSVEGAVLPGEPGQIHFRCRNTESLTFRAYRVELFALIRGFERLNQLKDWRPKEASVATWKVPIPDRGEHKHFDSRSDTIEPAVLPTQEPGAYVIVAEDSERKIQAKTVMLVSRLSCLTKGARSAGLLWAVDAQSGQPAAGVDVLLQRHSPKGRFDYTTGKTDDAGIYHLIRSDQADRNRGRAATMIVRDGPHYAVSNSSFYWFWWGYGQPYRAYTFTERPVYRPDQVVHFKSVLRRYEQGVFENLPDKRVSVQVYNPRSEMIEKLELTTNDQGSVSGDLRLPDGAPLGTYRIALVVDGQALPDDPGSRFRIEEYRKPEFEVTVAAARPDYRIGQSVDVRVEARYYFGEPVAGADVSVTVQRSRTSPRFDWPTPWPWYFEDLGGGGPFRFGKCFWPHPPYWSQQRELVGRYDLTTDEHGVAVLTIDTNPLPSDPKADLQYHIEAEAADASRRVITGSGTVKVTHQPFFINLRPLRYVNQPGDTIRLDVEAKGPNEEPVGFSGSFRVHRLRGRDIDPVANPQADPYELGDKIVERPVEIGADGSGQIEWVADEEGPFRIVVAADDGSGGEVTGTTDLWVTRRGGRYEHYAYRDVELIVDRPSYAPGDTAKVLINTRFDSCYVLLTVEADDLLDQRMIFVKGGTHPVDLPITRAHVPNFQLAAAVLRDNRIYQDQIPVIVPPVDRFLTVSVQTPGEKFYPRQKINLEVQTADSKGAPAAAEVALMMVDASIYYIQPEFREQIEKHFYGRKRPQQVNTQTSFDFYNRGFGTPIVSNMSRLQVTEGMVGPAPEAVAAMQKAGLADDAGVAFATAEIRKDFPDTVLWAAHVNTDEAGRASVEVTTPDTLTTWRIHAIAVDRDTRVGQATSDVITRKDIIARLQAPRFLVEGDEPLLTVIAHNYLTEEKTVRVSLTGTGEVEIGPAMIGGRPVGDAEGDPEGDQGASLKGSPKAEAIEIQVPAGGETAVDFPARALVAGRARLTATVAADVDADAVQIDLPVITYGADRFVAQGGSIRTSDPTAVRTVSFEVPREVAPQSPLLEVHLSPSVAAVMIDALPYLLSYPYGCTEQTMSRFLPSVVTRRTLQELGIDLAAVRRKIEAQDGDDPPGLPGLKAGARRGNNPVFNNAVMDDMIRAGLERLAELQNGDGGWGWWGGGASNPYMTAYVVYGLTEAVAADTPFDRAMLERGVAFLRQRVASTESASRYAWGQDDDNVRTWMLYALANADSDLLAGDEVRPVLDRIYADRDGLTDYSRAMLMVALHRAGQSKRVAVLTENLYNTVRLDDELDTASWGESRGYRYWYDNGLEATAMVLRALLATDPDHAYVPRAVNWLVRNRRGSRWFSTKDTAFAVYALADYLNASGELWAEMTVGVNIDGRIERSFEVTPENALTFDATLIVAPRNLQPGKHTVELTRTGRGNLYYGVYLDYFTRQDPIEPSGHEIHITRKYVRLVPKEITKTRQVYRPNRNQPDKETYPALAYDRVELHEGEAIASGDLIEVQLTIEAKNNFEYLVFEDPKPAGCEPTELRSGYRWGQGPYDNIELRDQKTAFFASFLPQGTHELNYRLRCETPGTFHALPARAEAMYSPYVRGNSRSDKLVIGVK
ncbi:MAG: hypothetical protein GY778_11775 [bacterium]|nr:hypothetical protein [bacterium]